jgi:hypothetical protein
MEHRRGELDTAKTTPFTTITANGEGVSADVQPVSTAGASPSTFQATMEFLAGATIHRVPAESCQLASAPEVEAGYAAPVRAAASTKWMRPSLVGTATVAFVLYSKTTGDALNA